MTMTTTTEIKARNGVWTPWAEVLCVECDYAALKNSPRAQHYAKRLAAVAAMARTEEVARPEGDLMGVCNDCRCKCWVRKDVALLQQVGYKASELDWEGPFGWSLEQTGGMCAALVFATEGREIVVTAMDGEFFVGEYENTDDEDERWSTHIRTWTSASLYEGDELKDASALAVLVDACARQVIAFVRSRADGGPPVTEKEWQDRYEITSTKGRIWKRSELRKRASEMLKLLRSDMTPTARRAAVQSVLDDASFIRPRKGEVPARVIEAVAIEAMLRVARKDPALAEQLAIVDKVLAEIKKEES